MATIGTLQAYFELVTSEYADLPKFKATLTALLSSFSNCISLLQNLYKYFEIDTAVGDQLTKLGNLVGVSRSVLEPITGVYFSLDDPNLGLDQGIMQGPFDPVSGLVALPDEHYRQIVKMNIALHHVEATTANIVSIVEPLLAPAKLLIFDMNNCSVFWALTAPPADPIYAQLFPLGYFNAAPAGVQVFGDVILTNAIFGFDVENSVISGLDVGYMI